VWGSQDHTPAASSLIPGWWGGQINTELSGQSQSIDHRPHLLESLERIANRPRCSIKADS
jgi:hypothetical protein